MDAIKYIKEKGRMCRACEYCNQCPIDEVKGNYPCDYWEFDHPTEAIVIIEKWSEEHPQKTILDDFLEKYPNAPTNKEYGFPLSICPSELGYKNKCTNAEKYINGCVACWSRPLSEVCDE